MKKALPLLLSFVSIAAVYACSSDDGEKNNPTPIDDGGILADTGSPEDSGQPVPDDAGVQDSGVVPSDSPIDGIAAPAVIYVDPGGEGAFLDGPTWSTKANLLYFTNALSTPSHLLSTPATGGTATPVRSQPARQIGTTVDKDGVLLIVEDDKVVKLVTLDGGATPAATPIFGNDNLDGGALIQGLNDAVVRLSDNTLYVTEPAFFGTPTTNRIYRVTAAGAGTVAADLGNTLPRPNGIALTKDEKTLYVSLTQGQPVPHVLKYPVNADGSLGAQSKFVDVPAAGGADAGDAAAPGSAAPDGLAVDEAGNLYVAVKGGVDVFKADGSGKWGTIALPKTDGGTAPSATGVTFGGADRKTLFITSDKGRIFTVTTKVAGLPQ